MIPRDRIVVKTFARKTVKRGSEYSMSKREARRFRGVSFRNFFSLPRMKISRRRSFRNEDGSFQTIATFSFSFFFL